MGKFRQISTELLSFIRVKIVFSALSRAILADCLQTLYVS